MRDRLRMTVYTVYTMSYLTKNITQSRDEDKLMHCHISLPIYTVPQKQYTTFYHNFAEVMIKSQSALFLRQNV